MFLTVMLGHKRRSIRNRNVGKSINYYVAIYTINLKFAVIMFRRPTNQSVIFRNIQCFAAICNYAPIDQNPLTLTFEMADQSPKSPNSDR